MLAGFRSVEKEKHELMYSYAANKFQLYTKTLIPACIPYFFTGLKISAPMAITASILVDTLQGGNGLGCMLSQSLKGGMTRLVFWDIVLISAVIGILSFVLMGLIERLLPTSETGPVTKEGYHENEKMAGHDVQRGTSASFRSDRIRAVADSGASFLARH